MKIHQFIGRLRKGDSAGMVEVTIPQNFYRANGMIVGKEYLITIKGLENGDK